MVEAVAARLRTGAVPVLLGPGDDAAVVAAPDGRVVVTTDALVEGVHFRRDWSSAYDVGRRAAAANLADVAAMGAVGTALVVALAAPGDLELDWALGLADGLALEAARGGAGVVGGDTVQGPQVVVSVTALGDLQGRAPVTRSGARPGDVVVHVGRLGWSAAGLALLEAGAPGHEELVAAYRCPDVPYAAGPALARLGASAMCDVSDGLVADTASLARAGGVAVELTDLPVDAALAGAAARLGRDPLAWVLHGGEDHGLLATVPAGALAAARELGAVVVGRVRSGEGVHHAGRPVTADGWEHWS